MAFEQLAALIQGNGIFQIDLALLQAGDDGFQLLQCAFEGQVLDGGLAVLGRQGGSPTLAMGTGAGTAVILAGMTVSSQLRAPARAKNYSGWPGPDKRICDIKALKL